MIDWQPVQVNPVYCLDDVSRDFSCFFPEPGHVRLVGGASRCSGMLEMNILGEWKPVDERDWNLRLAGIVCGQLDCGSAVSTRRRRRLSHTYIWAIKSDCEASSMIKCFKSLIYSDANIEITCSGNTFYDIYTVLTILSVV